MPWTEVYFLKRSTLASRNCSSPVSTARGPSSSVIASTIDCRFSGDRDGAMVLLSRAKRREVEPIAGTCGSADEIAAVDDQDVAVDVIGSPAGQENDRSHQVGGLTPPGRGDVLDDAAGGVRIGTGGFGDRCLKVPRRDGIDLDVV